MDIEKLVGTLAAEHTLTDDGFLALLGGDEADPLLFSEADRVRRAVYGTDVYIRGLIEFTNYCKNNCSAASGGTTRTPRVIG